MQMAESMHNTIKIHKSKHGIEIYELVELYDHVQLLHSQEFKSMDMLIPIQFIVAPVIDGYPFHHQLTCSNRKYYHLSKEMTFAACDLMLEKIPSISEQSWNHSVIDMSIWNS